MFYKNFSFWVALFVVFVGLAFSVLPFVENSFIDFQKPRSYFLVGFSVFIFLLGCFFLYLSQTGRLESKGPPMVEVRKEAIGKIKSKNYLAKIAREDPDPEVRQKAEERLIQIS